jgi:hypothetical protein
MPGLQFYGDAQASVRFRVFGNRQNPGRVRMFFSQWPFGSFLRLTQETTVWSGLIQ